MTLSLIAAAVSFVLTLLIGRFLIPELRKLKAGQEIREDGPTWHKSKAGTPTMGGIMFILGAGVTVFILGWSFMLEGVFWHLYVYLFALIFGLIGFEDDYRKVRQHQNEGLTARQKFILQLAAAVVFLVLMRYEPASSGAPTASRLCSRRLWREGWRPSSSITTTLPRCSWGTPAACFWAARWQPWPLCSICPWC